MIVECNLIYVLVIKESFQDFSIVVMKHRNDCICQSNFNIELRMRTIFEDLDYMGMPNWCIHRKLWTGIQVSGFSIFCCFDMRRSTTFVEKVRHLQRRKEDVGLRTNTLSGNTGEQVV